MDTRERRNEGDRGGVTWSKEARASNGSLPRPGSSSRLSVGSSYRVKSMSGASLLSAGPLEPIDPREDFILPALAKSERFRRFPWKLCVHIVLVILITIQAVILSNQDAPYTRAMTQTWQYFFQPTSCGVSEGEEVTTRLLFTKEDFITSLRLSAFNYFQLNNVSTVSFLYRHQPSGTLSAEPAPFWMELVLPKQQSEYVLVTNAEDLGPLSGPLTEPMAELIDKFLYVNLHMHICNAARGAYYRSCYCWGLRSSYDFRNGGNCRQSLVTRLESPCAPLSLSHYLRQGVNWLNMMILVTALVYLVLLLNTFLASVQLYCRVRAAFNRYSAQRLPHPLVRRFTWHTLPLSVKLRFFSPWLLLILLGDMCALGSVYLNFIHDKNFAPSQLSHKLLSGLACLLLWTAGLRYLEYYGAVYAFIPTINTALPLLLPFLAGFLPIFMGYAVLATAAFGQTVPIFATVPRTLSTLWGVMNGDSIHSIINAAQSVDVLVAHTYMYTFIAVSIYVVVNIIIAIMEESYFQSRDLQRAVHLLLERSLKQLDEMDTTEPMHPFPSDAANREGEGEAEEQPHDGATSTTPAPQAEGQEEDGGEGGLPPAHTHPPDAKRERSHTLQSAHEREQQSDDVFETLVGLILRTSHALEEEYHPPPHHHGD